MLQELLSNVRKDTDEAAEKLKKVRSSVIHSLPTMPPSLSSPAAAPPDSFSPSPPYPQCDICVTAGNELLREGALRQFRKEVDFLESPFLQVLTGYNMLIDGLLEEIFKLVNPLHSIDIGMVLGCYNSFLYLKVRALLRDEGCRSAQPRPHPALQPTINSPRDSEPPPSSSLSSQQQDMIGRMRATIGCILSDKSKRAELSVMGHLTLVANIGASASPPPPPLLMSQS